MLQEYDEMIYEAGTWNDKHEFEVNKESSGITLTGREITTQIRCVLSEYEGLQEGYVILGIEVLEK